MGTYAIPFCIALTVSFAIFLRFTRSPAPSKDTLRRLVSIQDSVTQHTSHTAVIALEKREPSFRSASVERFLEAYRAGEKLKTLLIHAGSSISLSGLILSSVGAGAGCGLAGYISLRIPLVTGIAAIFGCAIPFVWLRIKLSRRLKAFNAALPDAIDLMARALVAGHSIGSSIEMVSQQSPEPLAFEFVQVFQQQRLGLQFRDALLQMGSRMPSRDLQFLITAILVQKETGGDLTEILGRASYVIRERVRIQGEVQTRTAQGRLTGWILGLLPLVMLGLINLVSPGYSDVLFQNPVGQKLLYAGATLIACGALVIRKIVDVQV